MGGPGRDDVLAWNYTKNGIFTVRSAYHLEMKLKETRVGSPENSSSEARHAGWNDLWSTEVPGKAKVHVWRALKNGLQVFSIDQNLSNSFRRSRSFSQASCCLGQTRGV